MSVSGAARRGEARSGVALRGTARHGMARQGQAGQGKERRASSTSRAAKPSALNMSKEYRRELRELTREERGLKKQIEHILRRQLILRGRLS